ncbi:hypothetical protein HPB50_016104 [Hyalomma asiaticum]|uniref:Uncharacterized protein n=1 Tax=Hyalomma asiaticum TaxID=266040 RepID=A0ACB7SYL0_HYAAI|nr:hypothetical protein HPB50_016104 [Hyalomma asiaticum]
MYKGWYSTQDELFLSESEVTEVKQADGTSQKVSVESGHPVEWMEEKNYLFRLSHFQGDLVHWLRSSEGVVKPAKFQKLLMHWIDAGLQDLSLSRQSTRVHWGIRVPEDGSQTIYVWLDALVNYLTVSGYPDKNHTWPPDCHVIGKDILKFHGIYWPAFLMAAGLEPPRSILCHSHWTVNDEKMSKSKGNIVCPYKKVDKYTADGIRYFLLKEGVPHSDGNFNNTKVQRLLNAELADTLGNLLSRCTAPLVNKHQMFPSYDAEAFESYANGQKILDQLHDLCDKVKDKYLEGNIYQGIDEVMTVLRQSNALVQDAKPWELAKSKSGETRLNAVLHVALEVLRVSGIVLQPVIPVLATRILDKLQVLKLWQRATPAKNASALIGLDVKPANALLSGMDTKPGLAPAPASASQGSLPGESAKPRPDSEAGKNASTAPVSSAPAVPIAFSPSATNALSPPNRNLSGLRPKRDSVKSGRPHDPSGEHKSALAPREQPKDLADTAALPTAMTSQDAPQRHRRHLPHKSSRGAQHQASEAGNQEKHRGKRHKHKASGAAGCVGEGAKKSNLELSPPVVHSELQPQATSPEERKNLLSPTGLSEDNTLETIETRVADVFSNAEHSLGQQRSENASEKPGCSDSAVTAENARCDEGSKDDGVQSGTTVSHDVEGKAVVGAAANHEADRGAGRKIGKVVVSRELDKTPVGTIASAGAHGGAGTEVVENSGCACAKEGDSAGVEEPKKQTGVTVVSPHAEAENIGETRRESPAAVTPTSMTQRMTASGRQRCKRKSVDQRSLYSLTTLRDLASITALF